MEDPWNMDRVLAEFANESPSEQNPYLLVREYTSGLEVCAVGSSSGVVVTILILFTFDSGDRYSILGRCHFQSDANFTHHVMKISTFSTWSK
jgi:hypothetical protein